MAAYVCLRGRNATHAVQRDASASSEFFPGLGAEVGSLHAVVVLEDVPGGLDGALEGGGVDDWGDEVAGV